jgi:GcrA cell cycle regulator
VSAWKIVGVLELVQKRWAVEGESAGNIANEINTTFRQALADLGVGHVTRNAVIGICSRKRWTQPGRPARQPVKRRRETAADRGDVLSRPLLPRTIKPEPPTPPRVSAAELHAQRQAEAEEVRAFLARPTGEDVPPGDRVYVTDLRNGVCRYPIGNDVDRIDRHFFCGVPCGLTGPYCSHHTELSYVPTRVVRASQYRHERLERQVGYRTQAFESASSVDPIFDSEAA